MSEEIKKQMREHTPPPKYPERGYRVIWLFYLFDIAITCFALYMQWWVVERAFEVAQMNYQLAIVNGGQYYSTIIPFTVEFTALSIVIGALQAAFAVIANAQFKKKAVNNIWEHAELWLNKWITTPETAPYVSQVLQTLIQSNPQG